MSTTNPAWELPFRAQPELELQSEFGVIALEPAEHGETPRLELTPRSAEHINVRIEPRDNVVRVALEPNHNINLFGGWECRATLFLPRQIRAHIQANAGTVSARGLDGCQLGVKAGAGKIELRNVHGLFHLAADAGSVTGQDVGGFFDVETQAGSIRLEIDDLQPGEHRFRAAMGSVRLELARGLDASIETRTSLGSIRNEFPSRQGAPARLLVTTEMGSIRVEGSASVAARPRTYVQEVSTPSEERSDPELERVLKMVESGELSAQDADELLRAMGRV